MTTTFDRQLLALGLLLEINFGSNVCAPRSQLTAIGMSTRNLYSFSFIMKFGT